MSSANTLIVKNRLAQTITINDEYYGIGKVFCYFYGPYGNNNFIIHLDTYTCSNDGKPSTLINSQILSGTNVVADGWYSFTLDLSGLTPSNRYLSFVVWQENGDENNYALWGYYDGDILGSHAWFSNDNSTWTKQDGVVRALKVVGIFDPYDLTDYKIVTPPAEEQNIVGDLSGGTNNGTKFVPGSAYYNPDKVLIDYPNLLASFVVDASGSMGWNDRWESRIDFINKFIERFKNHYPSEVLFDIVKFGSQFLDTENVTGENGTVATINLDLSSPTRTTYVFYITSGSANQNDVYSANNVSSELTFTVLHDVVQDTSIACVGLGDSEKNPLDSGILTKVSGTGDSTLTFGSYKKTTIKDLLVSYGFKNLEEEHVYNIGEIKTSDRTDSVDITNWQTFLFNGFVTDVLAINNNGPRGIPCLDINGELTLIVRKPYYNGALQTSKISLDVDAGDDVVKVDSLDPIINLSKVDLIDWANVSLSRDIISFNNASSTIIVSPNIQFDIKSWYNGSGIVQQSNFNNAISINATTIRLLVRDEKVENDSLITFYLQTTDGYLMEWDFKPHPEWYINNLYWIDETANLTVKVFDSNGNPFKDGTEVYFYVGGLPVDASKDDQIVSEFLTKDIATGGNKAYIASTSNFNKDDSIDIVDQENLVQTVIIDEVVSDNSGKYLQFSPVAQYPFTVVNKAKVVKSPSAESSNVDSKISSATLLPSSMCMVDVTPIYTGKNIDVSLLEPYDPPPVSPSTDYEDLSLNLDRDRIKMNIHDMPTIDGYAVIRVLPITEDNLKTVKEKQYESQRLLRLSSSREFTDQMEQNQSDEQSLENNSTTTTTTTLVSSDVIVDYDIDSPVLLDGGYATAHMTTYAVELEEMSFNGVNMAGVNDDNTNMLLVKHYNIIPAIVINDFNDSPIAKQFLEPFDIYFTPPIRIISEYYGGNVTMMVSNGYDEACPQIFLGYDDKSFRGVYATDDGFRMKYIIDNKNELMFSGQLNVKIYSNKVVDMEKVGEDKELKYTRQDLNVVLPQETEVVDGASQITQPLTKIDQWRQDVESNMAGKIIEEASTAPEDEEYRDGILRQIEGDYIDRGYVSASDRNQNQTYKFEYYSNPWEWTKATEFGTLWEQTIDIIDGKAWLTIPSSDVSSLLLIQASVSFGDNNKFEVIRSDLVFVANPIDIKAITPNEIYATGGNDLYEIGTSVTWKGLVIPNNVEVNFNPPTTKAVPSVSKTDDGWAGGIQLGPHALVEMECPDPKSTTADCPCVGIPEEIEVAVSYLGYNKITTRMIEWTGKEPEDISDEVYFKVYNENESFTWADGNNDSYTTLFADIENGDPFIDSISIEALEGKNQPQGKASTVSWTHISGLKILPVQQSVRWESGRFDVQVYGLNRNIGNKQLVEDETQGNVPWINNIQLRSKYNRSGQPSRILCLGVDKEPSIDLDGIKYFYPQVQFQEPLEIKLSLENLAGIFIRDGIHDGTVVAEVKWKGQPLDPTYFSLPDVIFKEGISLISNSIPKSEPKKAQDERGEVSGCLDVGEHPDVKLDSHVVTVSISRTSIDNGHTHEINIDSIGNGVTTSTIVLNGSMNAHVHIISDYVAQDAGDPLHSHSHMRSVAVAKLKPTTNKNVEIVVNGYVRYDPTKCEPYTKEQDYSKYDPTYTVPPNPRGNRMMFSTLYANNDILNRKLLLDLESYTTEEVDKSIYTSKTIDDTTKGFNIIAYARFSEYYVLDSLGNLIYVPPKIVSDGTRIIFEINSFKPLKAEDDSNILIINPEAIREYMYVRLMATVYAEELSATAEMDLVIRSNLNWLPYVDGVLQEPTNDSIYINNAISYIDAIGSSQIHDAVKIASDRIIRYQTSNVAWKNASKAVFLLTDGDENTSRYSLNQAVNNVNFIDGKHEVPVIPIRLGYAYNSDDVLMRLYALGTGGKLNYLINADSNGVVDFINDLLTNDSLAINKGTYGNIIDLGFSNLPIKVLINNFALPTNSLISFRTRYSYDNVKWSTWSDWIDSSDMYNFDVGIDSVGQYFQYQVMLHGNEFFESPELYSGMTLHYYKYQNFIVFFQPVDLDINTDEYLASIHITHTGTIPSTSIVNYGYAQFNTTEISDYSSITRPLVTPDRHTIILTRYNEILLTDDNKTYRAINGGWCQNAEIEVYKMNNISNMVELVNSKNYAINSANGFITFYNVQSIDDIFVICIYFDPVFRVICNIINYGSRSVSIDNIGILYNVSKRVPKDSSGNIIHIPISKRI
jgi:hypothetical protein